MINTTDPLLSHGHKQQRHFHSGRVKKLKAFIYLIYLFNMQELRLINIILIDICKGIQKTIITLAQEG